MIIFLKNIFQNSTKYIFLFLICFLGTTNAMSDFEARQYYYSHQREINNGLTYIEIALKAIPIMFRSALNSAEGLGANLWNTPSFVFGEPSVTPLIDKNYKFLIYGDAELDCVDCSSKLSEYTSSLIWRSISSTCNNSVNVVSNLFYFDCLSTTEELQKSRKIAYQRVLDSIYLLKLPPVNVKILHEYANHYDQITKNQASDREHTTIFETDEEFVFYLASKYAKKLSYLVPIDQKNNERINAAIQAQSFFDKKDTSEVKNHLKKAIDLYKKERMCGWDWFCICNALNVNKNDSDNYKKEYKIESYHDQLSKMHLFPANFESYIGKIENHYFHEKIVDILNNVIKGDYANSKSFQINTNYFQQCTSLFCYVYLNQAVNHNLKDEIQKTFTLINFCKEISDYQSKVCEIHQQYDSPAYYVIWGDTSNLDKQFIERWNLCLNAASSSQIDYLKTTIAWAKIHLKKAIVLACQNSKANTETILTQAKSIINKITKNDIDGISECIALITKILCHSYSVYKLDEDIIPLLCQQAKNEHNRSLYVSQNHLLLELFKPIETIFKGALEEASSYIETLILANFNANKKQEENNRKEKTIPEMQNKQEEKANKNPQSSNQEDELILRQKIMLADNFNKNMLIKENINISDHSKDIYDIQIPFLKQDIDLLENLYGKEYNTLDGYYAIYAAIKLNENPQANKEQFVSLLNNRTEFEQIVLNPGKKVINTWREFAGKKWLSSLISEEMVRILPQNIEKQTIIYDSLFFKQNKSEKKSMQYEQLIKEFQNGTRTSLICILNTVEHHWYTVLLRNNKNDKKQELIIVDSLGKCRFSEIENPEISNMHKLFENLKNNTSTKQNEPQSSEGEDQKENNETIKSTKFSDENRQNKRLTAWNESKTAIKCEQKFKIESFKDKKISTDFYQSISAWPIQHQYHQEIVDIINFLAKKQSISPEDKAMNHVINFTLFLVHIAYFHNLWDGKNHKTLVEPAIETGYALCSYLMQSGNLEISLSNTAFQNIITAFIKFLSYYFDGKNENISFQNIICLMLNNPAKCSLKIYTNLLLERTQQLFMDLEEEEDDNQKKPISLILTESIKSIVTNAKKPSQQKYFDTQNESESDDETSKKRKRDDDSFFEQQDAEIKKRKGF